MLVGKSTTMTKRLTWLALQVWYFGLQYYNYSIYKPTHMSVVTM